jgi:hypothetical protein
MSSLPPPDPDGFFKGLMILISILVLYAFLTNGMRMLEERDNMNVPEYMLKPKETNASN